MMTKVESATDMVNSAVREPNEQVRVAVWASDPITLTGLTEMLLGTADVFVAADPFPTDVDVLVFAADRVTPEILAGMSKTAAESAAPAVLVARKLERTVLMRIAECRLVAVLHRDEATGTRLADTIRVAAEGRGVPPANLPDELLVRVDDLNCEILSSADFTAREVGVLRLLAEGWDTEEISKELCYSERTVKNIIYAMTSRLELRNRSQLVAYAVRAGVI